MTKPKAKATIPQAQSKDPGKQHCPTCMKETNHSIKPYDTKAKDGLNVLQCDDCGNKLAWV